LEVRQQHGGNGGNNVALAAAAWRMLTNNFNGHNDNND
jgi:hypothetical protein